MVEVNLLPQSYRKQSEPSIWRNLTYALIPLTAAAILIPEVMTATRVGDLTGQLQALEGEEQALRPAKAEFDTLSREKSELEQVTTIATQLRSAKTYWVNDLAAFTGQLPSGSGVAISSLNMRNMAAADLTNLQQTGVYTGKNVTREIELSGTAASQQAVVNFLRTFENNPNFGVNFRSMQGVDNAAGEGGVATGERSYTFNAAVGVVTPLPEQPAQGGTEGAEGGTEAPPAAPAPGAPSSQAPAGDQADAPVLATANGVATDEAGGRRVQ